MLSGGRIAADNSKEKLDVRWELLEYVYALMYGDQIFIAT